MIDNRCYSPNIQDVSKSSVVMSSKDEPLFGKASRCINNSILIGKVAFVASMVFLTGAASIAVPPLAILGVSSALVGLAAFLFTQVVLNDNSTISSSDEPDLAYTSLFTESSTAELQLHSEILQLATKQSKNFGTLVQNKAYVYLKLDRNYLSKIFKKIKTKFPMVKRATGKTGPHISIIRHDEWKDVPPKKINELFQKHHFQPVACKTVPRGSGRLWMLTVQPSAELQTIRNQYALGNKPHGHNFHITIAEEANSAKHHWLYQAEGRC